MRLLPHAVATELIEVGSPSRDAPVLVTGNYALTVRRLLHALRGRDAWLLVANSRGINVWCAAGGGHFTHHDVIAAVRATDLASRVDSRHLVLPQLSATGVERRKIEAATGFRASWGPARLEDLPEYLERGYRLRRAFRTMTFPAWERAELALTWAVPMAAIAAAVLGYVQGGLAAVVAAASVIVTVVALFLAIPWVVVTGWRRAFTYAAFAVIGTGIAVGLARALGATVLGSPLLWWLLGAQVVSMAVCSMDLAGTTPIYPSTINHLGNHFVVELVEEKCTGAADCVLVCPRDVLAMDGTKRKVRIARSDDCIRCGACIVQCPSDALQFRFDDGSVADPATVRSTRLNMLGRRSVKLSSSD